MKYLKIAGLALGILFFCGTATAEAAIEPAVTRMVNINTASLTELIQLPGVGLIRANDIIAYRTAHPFNEKTELLRIKGFSPRLFRQLAKRVTVDGPTNYLKIE